MNKFKIRTDLAIELKDENCKEIKKYRGIEINEIMHLEGEIKVTKVFIKNKSGAELIGKQIGKYITIETKNLDEKDEDYHREISKYVSMYLQELLPEKCKKILVVGLGNREATPDSLGPRVVDNIFVTRNMTEIFSSINLVEKSKYEISAVAPGVMAQTGMESVEIIRGIVEEIKPDVVIAIDSLAARNISRLNTTIQISDAGINPGSGVGNHRKGITSDTVGANVIGIGIPTVVDAATIVNDTLENIIEICSFSEKIEPIANELKAFSEAEKYEFIKEILSSDIGNMYVTPKDVDETVKYLSYTIAEGINML